MATDPADRAAPRSRWTASDDVPTGDDYDARFARLAAAGHDVHGEASLVEALAPGPRVLDAGCGTGRVAIELDRRGFDVVGVDVDPRMLRSARTNAPHISWIEADLAAVQVPGDPFDLVVLAGNVLIFVEPEREADVVARCASHVAPGGLVVAGFQVRADGYDPDLLDHHAEAAGLTLVERWSTWDCQPWTRGGDYQVSVHRRPPA